MHLYLEIAAAGMAMVPLVAVFMAWRRSHDRGMAMALLAFLIFEARLISMVLIHTVVAADHTVEELTEFVGDLAVIAAFAAAFLYGARWRRGSDAGGTTGDT